MAPIVVTLLMIVGCVSKPQKTLEELNASQEVNKKSSTRTYSNQSPEAIKKAAQNVLYLLDPGDIKFDTQNEKLLAIRSSMFYGVFSITRGRDWYEVTAAEKNGQTTVNFALTGEYETGIMGPLQPIFKTNIPISAYDNPEDFNLFFDQMEYFLGIKKQWATCEMAQVRQANKGQFLRLCDSLGLENYSPTDTIPTRPKIK